MNQFLDAIRSIPRYLTVFIDTLRYYIKMVYYSIFTVLTIKHIDSDNLTSNRVFQNKIPYLKYLFMKLLYDINDMCHLQPISNLLNKFRSDKTFNKRGSYFLKIYNHNNMVKTICKDITLFDIILLKNQLGDKKTDGVYGSKLITKIKIIGPNNHLNITDHIMNYCQYGDVQITLNDVLFCENIDRILYDEIFIHYIDYATNLESISNVWILEPHLHKNIYEIL
jgi:hypothetical protein